MIDPDVERGLLEALAAAVADLPGDKELRLTDQHASFFHRGQVVLMCEVTWVGHRFANWLTFHRSAFSDPPMWPALAESLSFSMRPWLREDRPWAESIDWRTWLEPAWLRRSRSLVTAVSNRLRSDDE